jgi:hypothetical protein
VSPRDSISQAHIRNASPITRQNSHTDNLDKEVDPQDSQEKQEEERKRRIQLYVFVSRCIAYPFNSKQSTDMIRRHSKITRHLLEVIQSRFQVRLEGTFHSSLKILHVLVPNQSSFACNELIVVIFPRMNFFKPTLKNSTQSELIKHS